MLMETGRPRATATDRSRVNKVHQMRFQSLLSALLSCEDSILGLLAGFRDCAPRQTYLLCMPEPCATMTATLLQ